MLNRHGVLLGLLCSLLSSLGGCTATTDEGFTVIGVSGEEVLLDRRWDRGCIPGGPGLWIDAQRTLNGVMLATTLVDYRNDSEAPDCTNGRSQLTTFTQRLTNDNVRVPITWVDFAGMPAAAPPGLESVTEANGATGLMTAASRVPETEAQAAELNTEAFCGFTDWQVGTGKDLVACFTGGINPGRGTIVVDDRVTPWVIYDGVGMNPAEYPSFMPNYLPHSGPFD